MSEKNEQEQLAGEDRGMQNNVKDTDVTRKLLVKTKVGIASVEAQESQTVQSDETQRVQRVRPIKFPPVVDTPIPLSTSPVTYRKKVPDRKPQPIKFGKRDAAGVGAVLESCRQLCLSLFFREHDPVRSLGFTSSIKGEGKSFLALVTAQLLARDSSEPVTLIDCNWEHPTLHEHFDVPSTPGLAEWLRGTCNEDDIRYQVDDNLTVIPAGNGSQDAVKLLKQVQRRGLPNIFQHSNELFIADLPPIITTAYGPLAASLLESIMVVVRAQAIPNSMVVETCAQLKDVPIHGIILNQGESRIPRWIRQLL